MDGVIISAYYALTPREIGGIGVQYINKAFMHSADKTECAVFNDWACRRMHEKNTNGK